MVVSYHNNKTSGFGLISLHTALIKLNNSHTMTQNDKIEFSRKKRRKKI